MLRPRYSSRSVRNESPCRGLPSGNGIGAFAPGVGVTRHRGWYYYAGGGRGIRRIKSSVDEKFRTAVGRNVAKRSDSERIQPEAAALKGNEKL